MDVYKALLYGYMSSWIIVALIIAWIISYKSYLALHPEILYLLLLALFGAVLILFVLSIRDYIRDHRK